MKQPLTTLALCLLVLTGFACGSMQATGETTDETTLVSRVQSRLGADPKVGAFDIDVSAQGRLVTLTGKVDDEGAARAVKLAGDTSGVQGVINKLEVPRPQNEIDAEISSKVVEALAELDGANIDVRTENAIVTLSGTVASDDVRNKAVAEARTVSGVDKVRDALRTGDVGMF